MARVDDASPTARRNVEILREFAARPPAGRSHRIELRFCRSPVEILGDGDGPVTGVRVVRNRLEPRRAAACARWPPASTR